MIEQYIEKVKKRYNTGISTEHSYRADLQNLLEELCPGILVTNEPVRITCGAPDYILTKNNIPVGYIEAKDLGANLSDKAYKEQFDRYKASLTNLIITNYLEFRLYREGQQVTVIELATIDGNKIIPANQNFQAFQSILKEFSSHSSQTIRTAEKLSVMMANKARLLANIIENAILADETNESDADNSLREQLSAFKQILIHDIKPKEFSDIYAQTIAYGMFAARLHDQTLGTFTRQEAAELIPKSNPFLRKLFQYVAGYDLDSRIQWIVDALADIFRSTDVQTILKTFGKSTQQQDPIIHFYETFLAEYDPSLRKSRGVWYTPKPVVNFIVRSVNEILQSEFSLKDGLADVRKIKIKEKSATKATTDTRSKIKETEFEREIHKVQILDPATGTGTFLAEIISLIHKTYETQQGIWSSYVDQHLIPRLNGFELLMASYAMGHLKMDLLLTETGYRHHNDQRFRIYLTNSLEEYHPDTGTLFASWLSSEANEANRVKRDTPVMVILGNPPYSGESQNKGNWITELMNDYKKEPNSSAKLKERNSKWINDDYVKFIRFGQYFIDKNGEGILAYITPHGFLENPTFRGMRWSLLKSFDKIYTIDLHGNSTKQEVSPDGSPDMNVFDIKQGVAITFFIKTSKEQKQSAKVYHYDVFGKRDEKYSFLEKHSWSTIPYSEIELNSPNYLFLKQDTSELAKYSQGIRLSELFQINILGVVTAKDEILIDSSITQLIAKVEKHYNITADRNLVQILSYRPFDNRYIYYDTSILERPREKVMRHMQSQNYALNLCKIGRSVDSHNYFLSNHITDKNLVSSLDSVNTFPLYIYPESGPQQSTQSLNRRPNFNLDIIEKIERSIGMKFIADHNDAQASRQLTPLSVLDYVYAVLYSSLYRERYKHFLKTDFPIIPYPKNNDMFFELAMQGSQLRANHLFEEPNLNEFITQYPIDGPNLVETSKFNAGRVYINETQYFGPVSEVDWTFFIGGYQPAQKWLKDRKGSKLTIQNILNYQQLIVAINRTRMIMDNIDQIISRTDF